MKRYWLKWGDKIYCAGRIFLVGIVLLFIIFSPVLGGMFLLSIDKYHADYRTFLVGRYLNQGNYYDGEVWFSAAATIVGAVISAVPGLVCGIWALAQTRRLHNLEARYHRPMMEIEEIGLYFVRLSHFREDKRGLCLDSFDMRQRNGIREANNQSVQWWIDLEVVLFSTSGITIKNMGIESVTFVFPDADLGKTYKLCLIDCDRNSIQIRGFKRDIRNGHIVYALSWSLNPFKMKWQTDQEEFERCISEFVFYSSEGCDPRYSRMELSIDMRADYEYREGRKTNCLVKVLFEAEHVEETRGIIENKSVNGYFTYEV